MGDPLGDAAGLGVGDALGEASEGEAVDASSPEQPATPLPTSTTAAASPAHRPDARVTGTG